MGMDVTGLNPSHEQGKYFRSNVWCWRPINKLMGTVNMEYNLGIELSPALGLNEGAGLNGEQSVSMALALALWIRTHDQEEYTYESPPIGPEAAMLNAINSGTLKDHKGRPIKPAEVSLSPTEYRCPKEMVQEFIAFLFTCGGFEVW